MESAAATRNCSMKVIPSIAFGEFFGSAGDVTARSIGGRTILNHKAYQSKVKTPAQAVSRNTLSKVSRAYKQLTDSQMKAWGALAEHLKGISTFGKAAEMTAHNAFVRVNSNRQLVGKPMCADAPAYLNDIPKVDIEDFWVSPDTLLFSGIEPPRDSYYLVVKMGPAQSMGVSSGWNNLVIISPDMIPDWGEVDLWDSYQSRFGNEPVLGQKYFIEMYWLDSDTGFVGETVRLKAIASDLSQIKHLPYTAGDFFYKDYQYGGDGILIKDFSVKLTETPESLSVSGIFEARQSRQNAYLEFPEGTENVPLMEIAVLCRGTYYDPGEIGLLYIETRQDDDDFEIQLHPFAKGYENRWEIFDTTYPSEHSPRQ